jgi:cytochrome c biogenesis protein CcdA
MAFAILGVASSFGGAIINETTLFISIWGWRDTFRIIAGILLGFTVIAFFILNEPARGKFTFIKKGQNAT